MTDSPSILFICTGNLCRSPMAQALFLHLLQNTHLDEASQWRIESAGTWTEDGKPAAMGAQAAIDKFGLSLRNHLSVQVTNEMMENFNLVLVMEEGHKEALRIEFPHRANRIFLLSEMVGARFEIKDPIGGEPVEYESAANQIEGLLEQGLGKIRLLAQVR